MVQLQPNVDGSNYRNFEEDLGHWYAGARFSDVDKEQMKKHWKRLSKQTTQPGDYRLTC